MTDTTELPPLPEPDSVRVDKFDNGRRVRVPLFAAHQMQDYARAYAAEAVRVALDDAAAAVMSQVEACAEYTYGHPREKALEWAKEDKFDSECTKAEELLSIAARAIRALKVRT